MKKVFQLLNKAKAIPGDVGIEIECEGRNLGIVDSKYWSTEQDGSLRGTIQTPVLNTFLKSLLS